jgi:hypothetical protein
MSRAPSEALERVKRAIFDAKDPISGDQLGDLIDTDDPLAVCEWVATAAIEALREPTEAMLDAACATEAARDVNVAIEVAANHGVRLPAKYNPPNTPLTIWWRAMIDAARKARAG